MSVHEHDCVCKNVHLLLHVCCCLKSRTGLWVLWVGLWVLWVCVSLVGKYTQCGLTRCNAHKLCYLSPWYWASPTQILDKIGYHYHISHGVYYDWWTTSSPICKIGECIFDKCIYLHLWICTGITTCTKCYVYFLFCFVTIDVKKKKSLRPSEKMHVVPV